VADFLTTLQSFESGDYRHPDRGGSNIANTKQGTSSGQAQGFNQITTGTWKEFGGLAYAPTPLQATPEQQNAIAAKIPLQRWAPETLNFLRSQGFTLNPKATLADNIAANHGTLGVATPPHTPTPGTTINTTQPSGAPTTPAGGPGAPSATGLAGQLATALKPLTPGGKGAAGDGGQADEPQPMRLPQAPMAQAVGGPMMMGQGGQNVMGQRIAQNDLAQRGFSMQPQLASTYGALGATKPVVQPIMPGQATGVPGLPGTTLNSPSQMYMALQSGAMSPYDLYASAVQSGAYGSGSF